MGCGGPREEDIYNKRHRIEEAISQEAVPPRAVDNHIIKNRSAGQEGCVQIGGVSITYRAALLQILHYQKMAQHDILMQQLRLQLNMIICSYSTKCHELV